MFLTTFLPFMLRGSASTVVVAPVEPYVEDSYVVADYVAVSVTVAPTIQVGTFTFAQAPTDADIFPTPPGPAAILDQAIAANLGITGIRHNLLVTGSMSLIAAGNYSRWDAQWAAMKARNLKLYLCLFDGGPGGTNNPYPGKTAGTAERTAWANAAVTAMLYLQTTYSGLLAAVEVWNEPDGGWPIPSFDMVLLVQAVRTAMDAQPAALANIPLVAPATVVSEGTYWQNLVDSGMLSNVPWVSHHMYSDPHVLERRVGNLRTRLASAGAANKPIFVSEFGANRTVPVNTAHDIASSLTMLRALNLYAASYFTLQDYGTAFADSGLLNSDGSLAAQGTCWKVWHQTVGGGATYVGRELGPPSNLPSNVQCHRFTVGATTVRVVWATAISPAGAPRITITGTYTAKDAFGTALTAGAEQTLGLVPRYLTGNITVTFSPISATQELLLADPEVDFSTVQGQNGWTYQSLSGAVYTDAVADAVNDRWTLLAGSSFWQISPTLGHPAAGAVAAVRKWTVPATGRVRVAGTWARGPGGDGSGVTLRRNTTIQFQRAALLNATATINQVFDVVAGNVLEFRVDPGPATDITSDSTALRVQIYSAPGVTPTATDIA